MKHFPNMYQTREYQKIEKSCLEWSPSQIYNYLNFGSDADKSPHRIECLRVSGSAWKLASLNVWILTVHTINNLHPACKHCCIALLFTSCLGILTTHVSVWMFICHTVHARTLSTPGCLIQWFFFSRNIGYVTTQNIELHSLKNLFLDQRMQQIFDLILKTEAPVS